MGQAAPAAAANLILYLLTLHPAALAEMHRCPTDGERETPDAVTASAAAKRERHGKFGRNEQGSREATHECEGESVQFESREPFAEWFLQWTTAFGRKVVRMLH